MKWRRSAWVLGLALATVTCSDPGPLGTAPGIGTLRVRVVPPPSLVRFAPGLVVEQVKASLVRFVNDIPDTVDTQTVPFDVNTNTLNLSFSLVLASPTTLNLELEYQTLSGQALFVASQQVTIEPGVPSTAPPVLQPSYIGPGSNLAFLSLTPLDSVMTAGDSVIFDATAIDANQTPVTSFYVSWTSSDPRVPINALGQLKAPDLTKLVTITALTPNGTFATTTLTIQGSAGLGLNPDSVEKLPGGTQQFSVVIGALRTSQFVWSVNGTDGGNATFGTVDATGFYTAPASVPSQNHVSVCARDVTRTGIQGCAVVVISRIPSAGADVLVFNDINFLADYDTLAGNVRLIRNLVSFSNTLPRSSGSQVVHEYSHASECLATAECDLTDLTEMNAVINGQGYQVVSYDTISHLPASIPPQVKTIFIWTPQRAYDTLEINTLKAFAAEGGRIVFLGEWLDYYGQFNIDSVENRFFSEMGAQLTNVGAAEAQGAPYVVPKAGIRSHQVTSGVSSLGFSAASVILPGPNDFPLVVDVNGSGSVLGAVAKIDLAPLPVPIPIRADRVLSHPAISRSTLPAGFHR
jgi:hypothetical protein